ncbi:hypothetical protein [Psychroserpens sp.]|uniref:hypothetical protein n=1 Tax=Psychroserpens sp. TaxID=2020870 RepID=UPI001B075383|nr:hypothetical protein [Psychroserpens sp.]MBO6607399.1 hypothetical protein [Psychroserpens sp.]MBO6654523.1 hypothetical protein [Psychroserpens sp.]MBO6681128.1 hypothetical protein [Psychroserpens sp.]MBO6749915.1 hypothetical protein [Psychroserpens sp.]MBO6916097.1 hypothetical protein [Psychroserpens sp.]
MKLKYLIPLITIAFLFSCSTDDNDDIQSINEVADLLLIKEIVNGDQTIELFNQKGMLETGYNQISMRLKDNTSNTYIEDATLSWMPIMQMPTMQHSCPNSAITKAIGKNTVYEGFIIYQMTNLDGSGWSITIDYTIEGINYTVTDTIEVFQYENQNVSSFMASDDTRYVLALIEPKNPSIAVNEMKIGLFKMENMTTFPVVDNYTIELDPRMPGMGNHSSPNNSDLTFNSSDNFYYGDLSLTMTGYWKLNLKLLNSNDDVIKGEDITDENEASSLYLELEF